jgi:hypothetical protein
VRQRDVVRLVQRRQLVLQLRHLDLGVGEPVLHFVVVQLLVL